MRLKQHVSIKKAQPDIHQTAGEADAAQAWTDVVPHPDAAPTDTLAHC